MQKTNWLIRKIEKFKLTKDLVRCGIIHKQLELFYSDSVRKQFIQELILKMNYNPEELETLGSTLSNEAHMRARHANSR